jgi:hypothetical protein
MIDFTDFCCLIVNLLGGCMGECGYTDFHQMFLFWSLVKSSMIGALYNQAQKKAILNENQYK